MAATSNLERKGCQPISAADFETSVRKVSSQIDTESALRYPS